MNLDYRGIEVLATAPPGQADPALIKMLKELVPSAVDQVAFADMDKDDPRLQEEIERVKTGLYKALDFTVHSSLGSGFMVVALRTEWEFWGGKRGDPAPWREEMGGA